MSTTQISSWLRIRREQLDLSQDEIAARLQVAGLNVTRATVSHWETGRAPSPIENLQSLKAVAKAFEVNILDLLLMFGDEKLDAMPLNYKERKAIEAWRRGDRAEAAKIILND